MARLRDLLEYKTYAIRGDGAKFVNGVRNDGADTSWLTYQSGVLTLSPGLYDELLILDRAATEDEILAWYESQAPFYDAETQIQGTHIDDGAITTRHIQANSITAASGILADASVVNAKIEDGAITTAKIGDAQITSAKILDGTITTADIGSAQITSALIADATISTVDIANAAITQAKIADLAVGTAQIADAAITNAKIASLDAGKITTGLLDAARIAAGSITAEKLSIGRFTPAIDPNEATLFHFDSHPKSTQGLAPESGYVATPRPGEGLFGGAVAVEEETTNLIPSNRLKFEVWTTFSDAQVTLTQNVEFPEIGRNDATRIRTTGGTSALKYYRPIEQSIAGQAYTGSVYIKNIGSKPVWFDINLGSRVTVNPGEWTRAIVSVIGNGTTNINFRLGALNADDDLDFIAWGPQVEHKPFATSFVDGTRAAGRLEYPGSVLSLDEATLVCWVKPHPGSPDERRDIWATNAAQSSQDRLILGRNITGDGWGFHFRPAGATSQELRSNVPMDYNWHMLGFRYKYNPSTNRYDLALIFDGQIVATGTSSTPGRLTNFYRLYSDGSNTLAANCLIDELLILNRAATEDEILSWYEAQSPFYDSSSIIQGTHIADGAITTDKLAANSVTAGKIAAGSVKANAIDVDELSAISADLGTVTAGIVQTPDGRAKFGEGALGSGKHGMLVSDGTQDRVAVGDVSGRPWGNTTLPSGSYGVWGSDARLFLKQYPRFYGMGTAAFNIEIPQGSAGDTIIGMTDTVEFVDYHGNPFPSISLVDGRTLHGHVSLQSVDSWVGNGNEYVMIQILGYFFRATVDGVPDQFIFFSGPEEFEKLALRIRYMMYYVKDQPFPFDQAPRGVRVVVSGIFLEEESTPSPIVYPL